MRLPFLHPREPQADRPRAATAADEPATIATARTRARQRLVGALVLLVIGVIGFPILFETQPRALPMNTPILVQGAEAGRPEAVPVAPITPAVPSAPPRAAAAAMPPADAGIESVEAAASAPGAASAPPRPEPASPRPAPVPMPMPAAPVAPAAVVAAAPAAVASDAAKGARFVVQVGAFSDATALREVRQKVEKLGFKTYTQDIESNGARRTRVRVGPYGTRDEADAAAGKLKRSGLTPAVLTL